jgi:hypothetical protein
MECEPQTIRLDRNRGFDRRQTLTLQTNSGANPARLYCPPIQKTQKEVVQLFRGHYTSCRDAHRFPGRGFPDHAQATTGP